MIGRMEQWLDSERDQLALWVPVALGCGIAGWFVIDTREGWIGFLLGASAILIGAMALLPVGRLRRGIAVFSLLMTMGFLLIWWRAESLSAPRLERPTVMQFTARVEKIERLAARNAMRITLAPDAGQEIPARVRVNLSKPPEAAIRPGMTVRLRARLMPPAPAALPGAYDFARIAWFRGLGATGGAIGDVEIIDHAPADGPGAWISDIRARLTAHVQRAVGGSAGGIAAALVTGDQGGISDADVEAMRVSGLAHLLSISGLHVGAVVAGVMFLMLRLLALSPMMALRLPLPLIAAAFAAMAGIAYTLIAGAEIPTVRSCIAALLILIALAMGREAMTLRLVATGALVVLLIWPEGLVSPSFQLSFAAVTALIAFHEHPSVKAFARRREGDGWLIRGGRSLFLLLVTGLVVETALSPIALYHFHRAGIYGSLANMIAIPLTTFIIMPAIFVGLVLDLVGLGSVSWWVTDISLNALINISYFVSNTPGAVAMVPTMPVAAFCVMVMAGLWFCLWRGRVRWWALPLFAIGGAWAAVTPGPDLLITRDGRHVAVRGGDGALFLLRPRAGDYVRETIGTVAAQLDLRALDHMRQAHCNADLCLVETGQGARRWRLLATRSPYFVSWEEMIRACAAADIVISDRRLPKACAPRWLKADRALLARTGGLAIRFDPVSIRTVRAARDDHPWMRVSPVSYPR